MSDYALGIAHDDEFTASCLVIVSPDTFAAFYYAARQGSDLIRKSTSPFDYDRAAYADYFLSVDGKSGYAVRNDGELVYVFSTVRGRGDDIVSHALRHGATYLDCFDGYLTRLYERNGFQTYKSESNWTPGGPAVVYMQVR